MLHSLFAAACCRPKVPVPSEAQISDINHTIPLKPDLTLQSEFADQNRGAGIAGLSIRT